MEDSIYIPTHVREEKAKKIDRICGSIRCARHKESKKLIEMTVKSHYGEARTIVLTLHCEDVQTFVKITGQLEQARLWDILFNGDFVIFQIIEHKESCILI